MLRPNHYKDVEAVSHASDFDAIDLLLDEGVVAYQRGLARAVGDAAAGLLLSQFWYRSKRLPGERDGWFFKTQSEIYEETVLTRREQETARRTLRDLGVLEENKRGVPSKLWFRINRAAVKRLLQAQAGSRTNGSDGNGPCGGGQIGREQDDANQDGGKRHSRMAESAIQVCAERSHKPVRSRPANTKTTPDTTTEITAAAPPPAAQGQKAAAVDNELVRQLLVHQMNRSDAVRLALAKPDECRRQLEYLCYLPPREKPGGWLRVAIENEHGAPDEYLAKKRAETQEAEAARRAAFEKARQNHEVSHRATYLAYLEHREAELQYTHPGAIAAFLAREEEERARYQRAPLTPTMLERVLRDHERRESYLERLRTFLSQFPDCAIVDFWTWDATLNLHPFRGENGTADDDHYRNHQPEGGRRQNDDRAQPGGRSGERRAPGARS
jgi:hypothetical protein